MGEPRKQNKAREGEKDIRRRGERKRGGRGRERGQSIQASTQAAGGGDGLRGLASGERCRREGGGASKGSIMEARRSGDLGEGDAGARCGWCVYRQGRAGAGGEVGRRWVGERWVGGGGVRRRSPLPCSFEAAGLPDVGGEQLKGLRSGDDGLEFLRDLQSSERGE